MTEKEEKPKINGAVEPDNNLESDEEDNFDNSLLVADNIDNIEEVISENIQELSTLERESAGSIIILPADSATQEISKDSNLESESAGFNLPLPADFTNELSNTQEISNDINLESEATGFSPSLPVVLPIQQEDNEESEETEESEEDIEDDIDEEDNDDITNTNKEEDSSERTPQKDLVGEMRGLLTNYPLYIKFSERRDFVSIIENLTLIKDLLNYCRYKTTKESILKLIDNELSELDKLNVDKLKYLYSEFVSSSLEYGKDDIVDKMKYMIEDKIGEISKKVQLFLLAIPTRGKRNMHLRSAHGLSAHDAEEYESSEIEGGAKITSDQLFKVSREGEVIPAD
ncbi:MAG: hypothetical protein WC979_09630 [Candidatus Pacearchaeota archaeon]|jgi:hypothetical protein